MLSLGMAGLLDPRSGWIVRHSSKGLLCNGRIMPLTSAGLPFGQLVLDCPKQALGP